MCVCLGVTHAGLPGGALGGGVVTKGIEGAAFTVGELLQELGDQGMPQAKLVVDIHAWGVGGSLAIWLHQQKHT